MKKRQRPRLDIHWENPNITDEQFINLTDYIIDIYADAVVNKLKREICSVNNENQGGNTNEHT